MSLQNLVRPQATPTPPAQPATSRPKKNGKLKISSLERRGNGETGELVTPGELSLGQILASAEFNLVGLVGTAAPSNQTVPKNTPTVVLTSIQVPDGEDPAAIISQLNGNYRIRGELTGPSFSSPRMIEVPLGQQIPIPPMPVVGDHVLQNLRIVDITDASNRTVAPVAPDSVGINVIDNVLVTQVQVTEMTYEQIVQSGINLSSANYNFYNFTLGLGTSSGTVPIQIPVAMPTVGGQQPVVGNPVGGVTVSGVSVPLPDVVPVMLQAETADGGTSPIEMPGGGGGIPGVVVFPGRIGLLHQFFEAIVIVANGAPNGTPLVITNLRATANLPDRGTPNDPSDDPLKIAETQQGGVQRVLEIHGLGPDGRYGTADDTTSFNPGQSGQATFLLEGLKEGLHTVDFDIRGTLQGLPGGNINVRGNVPGAVLVRDAQFGVTFTHPSVVRAGQEYDLGLTVYNSGSRNINGITMNLRGNSVSGAELIDSPEKILTQTIPPGGSGTVKWRLRSNTTGQVTASYVKVGENIAAGLNLVTGVGDRNVPLSPDSLILPDAVQHLPPDVVEAARQMLGQAWSVATAPGGSLPAGVLPVDKQTVVGKAIELGWAGLRIQFREDRDTSLRTLLRDWLGENQTNSSTGFADALRSTTAGYYFFDTVGTKFYETVGGEQFAGFHKKLVDAESSRSAFISAFVSQASGQQILGAKLISPANQSVGFGTNPGERFGDLRTGAALRLLQTDPHDAANNTNGNLLVVSKPASGDWKLELTGWNTGTADVSILIPANGKNYRQLVFGGISVTPGKRYRITFRASGTTAPVIEEFVNNAYRPASLTFTSYDAADPNPSITGVIQVTDDVIEGGDKYGRLVGVLFSKPMTKTSVESSTRYQIGGGELVSDPSQIVGRLIKPTSAVQNFGERFAIVALDAPVGPFIKRNLTANGLADKAGKVIAGSTKDIEMRVSPRGTPPGGYMTGRVMQADGTPVPNAGVYYRRNIRLYPCGPATDAWETLGFQKSDADGNFVFDYVREERCEPLTVLFQHTPTNSEKTIISNVAYHGQHLIFNAVFLARGNVQGTVTSGGVPLANASVSILSELDPLNNKLVKTNAQGFYSATGVPVGGVTVKAVGTGNYSLSSGIAAGNIDGPNATATVNVTTQNVSGVIKGKVLDNGNGQSPVRNAVVVAKAFIPGFITREPIPVGYSYTNDDGAFNIERLPVGNVFISAFDPQRGASNSTTVQLTEQNTRVENVLLLVSNGFGRVSGRVFNEVGQIIPNAVVQEGAQAVRADSSGTYVLPQTREGNATITATDPVTQQSGSTVVSVLRNEDTNNADIVIRRPASLNGQVFITENGATSPLAQAYVSADGIRIVRTDAQGRYALNNVESGRELIVRFVHPQGKLFINTSVFLNPGETLSRNATFRPAKVYGKITQPDGVTPVVTGVSFKTFIPNMRQGIFFGLAEEATLFYQTTTNGLYSFDKLNPREYTISSSNVFFPVPVTRSGILPPNANQEINLSLVHTLAGKIHGHIYQPDGVTPVGAGVKVSLGGGSLADVTVRTDAQGYYEFAEVFAEGRYVLSAVDSVTNLTNRTGIEVKKNEEMEVDLRLLGRGKLRVKVVDGGGVPLQTGSIELRGTNYPNDERYVELTPANNGAFEFTNLNEGNYAVSALYLGLGGRGAAVVTLGGTTEITIQVQAVGTITGRVFMPDSVSPVGLADVTLTQNGRTIGLITTDDSEENRGRFRFDYVPTGEFTIEVFDNRTGRKGRTAGRITAQGENADVRVNLLALGTVVGQVTSNGTPAAHALVNLSADGSGISGTSRVSTTDADGRFRFTGIPVGRVYITVTDGPGGLSGQSQGTVSGTLEPLPETVIDVALTPSATVTGTVYKFGGTEVYPGVSVNVSSSGFRSNATTDANGRYRIDYVPLGTINVKTEAPAGYDRGRSAPIISNVPGGTVSADVTMTGVGTVSGTAYASNGTPLSFGKVTFTNNFWNEGITVIAPVQSDGTYSMSGLPTGDFSLKLTVPEIIGAGTAVDSLAGGQNLTKNLQLESAGKVFGALKSPDGMTPAVGSDVDLTLVKQGQSNQSYRFVTHTDSNGNWAIDNLPLGTISIRFSDPNSNGVAGISGLSLNTNGQEINTGAIILDNSPIGVESVTPANGATNVARNTAIQVLFTEAFDPATVSSASVRLKNGTAAVSSQIEISSDNRTVTLTPNQILADTTLYTLEITQAVKDVNGNALLDLFTSSFTTADETAPAVIGTNPVNNAVEVPLDQTIVVTFNEALGENQQPSDIFKLAPANAPANVASGDYSLSLDRKSISFVPSALTSNVRYQISVTGQEDVFGNTQNDVFTSTFVTVNTNPRIAVESVTPANGAVNVTRGTSVQIVFNAAVNPATVNSGSIKLKSGNDPVNSQLSISNEDRTVTLTPERILTDTTLYRLEITTAVTDVNDIPLEQAFASEFTTADETSPVVVSANPADNTNQVSLDQNIVVTFDEALEENQQLSSIVKVAPANSPEASVAGNYAIDSDRKTITFDPSDPLASYVRYQIRVSGQKDVFGNTQVNAFTSAFTTVDVNPPLLYDFLIDSQAVVEGVTIENPRPRFYISYSDDAGIDAASTKLYLGRQGETPEQVPATVSQTSLQYQPAAFLEAGQYVTKVVVTDTAGNESSTPEITFTVNPQLPELFGVYQSNGTVTGKNVVTVKGRNLISQFAAPDDSARGLLAEYSNPNYYSSDPRLYFVRTDAEINFDSYETATPYFTNLYNENVTWKGKIVPRYSEEYNFTFELSGGARIYVGENLIADQSASEVVRQISGTVSLTAGQAYDIRIEQFGGYGSRRVSKLYWSSPSQTSEIVPQAQLRPAQTAVSPVVRFGGSPATVIGAVSVDSVDMITVLTPEHIEGTVGVEVQTETGTLNLPDAFTYYEDEYPPYAQLFSPSGANGIAPPGRVSVTFNEPLSPVQDFGNILKLYKYDGSEYFLVDGNVTIDETNRRLTFVPLSPLSENMRYIITAQNQRDVAGNVNTNEYSGEFSTTDLSPPVFGFTYPEDQSITFNRKPSIGAYYGDELSPIDRNSVKMILDGTDVTAQTSTYFSSIQYTPSSELSLGAHTVIFRVADVAGNAAEKTITFTVEADTEPPTIYNFTIDNKPAVDGMQTRYRRPSFSINFYDNGTVPYSGQKVFLGPQGGTLSPLGTYFNGGESGGYLYGYTSRDLAFGFYTVRVELIDDSGNVMTRSVNFELIDQETDPPYVTSVSPANYARGVSLNSPVVVTFNEPLDPNQNFAEKMRIYDSNNGNGVEGAFALGGAGNILTFTPNQPLAADTRYTVSAQNIFDVNENAGGDLYSSFSTIDTIAPSLETWLRIGNDQIQLDNARIYSRTPKIFINCSDDSEIDMSTFSIALDGVNLNLSYCGYASYDPPSPLAIGVHTITAQVADVYGNVRNSTETFEIAADPSIQFAVEDDTVLLWRLDDFFCGDGCFVPDSGPYRFPTDSSSFARNTAGRFDGGAGSPRIKTQGNTQILDFGANPFTVEGWINYRLDPDNPPSAALVIWSRGTNAQKEYTLSLLPNGDLQARIFNAGGVVWETTLSKTTFDVADGEWHSLAMAVERGAPIEQNQVKLYVDGELRMSGLAPANFGAVRNVANAQFALAAGEYEFKVDDIRISNTARTAEQIRKNFDRQEMGLVVLRTSPKIIQQGGDTEIRFEGYNLDDLSAVVTTTGGAVLPVTSSVLSATPISTDIRFSADAGVPLGDALLTLTRGAWTTTVPLRVVNQQPFTPEAGTLLLWHLDESGYTALDSGPYGINGFSYDITDDARFGKARSYDVRATSNPAVLNLAGSGFTVEGWFKCDGCDETDIFKKGDIGSNSEAFALDWKDGAVRARLRDSLQVVWEAKTALSQVALADNKWHYVSMVVRRGAAANENRLLIYIDGVERANVQSPAGFGNLRNTTQVFTAGGTYSSRIDDVRILNFARTPEQISETWSGASAGFGASAAPRNNKKAVAVQKSPQPKPDDGKNDTQKSEKPPNKPAPVSGEQSLVIAPPAGRLSINRR